MRKIIDILMDRDDMTEAEAVELVNIVLEEIAEAVAIGDYDLVEDIMYSDLGLEMDYIYDLMC